MQACSKCNAHAGENPVVLKNGACFCEACYRQMFPAAAEPVEVKPQRLNISVEKVLIGLGALGLIGVIFFIYRDQMNVRREEAAAERHAQELAAQRLREDRARADAFSEKAEAQRVKEAAERREIEAKREAVRIVEQEAAKAAIAKRNAEIEAKREAYAKKKAEEEAAQKDLLEKEKAREKRIEANAAAEEKLQEEREVLATVSAANKEYTRIAKAIAKAQAEKAELQRKFTTYKNIYETKRKAAEDIYKTYGGSVVVSRSSQGGGTAVTQPTGADQIVQQQKNIIKEAEQNLAKAVELQVQITAIDEDVAKMELALNVVKKRMKELNIEPPEIVPNEKSRPAAKTDYRDIPNPFGDRRPGYKTIFKKDGTTIQAKSVMTVETETRYKDENGEWKTLKSDEIEKVETNPGQ